MYPRQWNVTFTSFTLHFIYIALHFLFHTQTHTHTQIVADSCKFVPKRSHGMVYSIIFLYIFEHLLTTLPSFSLVDSLRLTANTIFHMKRKIDS